MLPKKRAEDVFFLWMLKSVLKVMACSASRGAAYKRNV